MLNDGNYYDYQPGLMLIRTVGSLKSGVIPNVDFGRSGYISKSPSAEDTIYTLQGIRLKENDARSKGIYIKNRRKIVK